MAIESLPFAPWILFTVFAAAMQSVRTAGQKTLTTSISPMSATLVRYLFGLPFAFAWLFFLTGPSLTEKLTHAFSLNEFILFAALAGVAQILATVLLVISFQFKNFMVGTSFAKTESLQTAVFGSVFFGFTSLWLRTASLSLGYDVLTSAAITLFLVVSFQSILCVAYTAAVSPNDFSRIIKRWPLAVFVGATSALGSVGWFTAMTWQNPALVKSLGQIEMLFTAALSLKYFREQVRWLEWFGAAAVIGSVVILILVAG